MAYLWLIHKVWSGQPRDNLGTTSGQPLEKPCFCGALKGGCPQDFRGEKAGLNMYLRTNFGHKIIREYMIIF